MVFSSQALGVLCSGCSIVKLMYLSQALGNLVLLASEEPPEEAVQRPDLTSFVKMLKV